MLQQNLCTIEDHGANQSVATTMSLQDQ